MQEDETPLAHEASNVSWREGGCDHASFSRADLLSQRSRGGRRRSCHLAAEPSEWRHHHDQCVWGTTSTPNNLALFVVGIIIISLGSLAVTVAWIGALIRTAQLGEWTWFVLLLVLQGITLLVYVIAGPDQLRQTAPIYHNAPPPPTAS